MATRSALPTLRIGFVSLGLLVTAPAQAAWPHFPGQLVLAVSTGSIQTPVAVADSGGGSIVAWVDTRNDAGDIYVQRVDVAGQVRWSANGVAAGVATGQQTRVVIASDGAAGAFLAWEDYRNGASNADVYCQHVTSTGDIAPGWPVDGLQVGGQGGNQLQPSIVTDGGTGAYVAWEDFHFSTADVFAKHLLAAGIDGSWPAIGATVAFSTSSAQGPVTLAADGVGGAYAVWQDTRNPGNGVDLYMNRILSDGSLAWGSATFGVGIAVHPADQISPVLAVTPGTGVTVLYEDSQLSGTEGWDLLSLFVTIAGVPNSCCGFVVAASPGDDIAPVLAGGANGATVAAWQQNTGNNADIEARLLCSGVPCGSTIPLSTASLAQTVPAAAIDGAGGAIVAWPDSRSPGEIYAQRLTSGSVASWTANGIDVGNTGSPQSSPAMVADSKGGAIIAFVQQHAPGSWLVAQRVEHFGYLGNPEPVITKIFDVASDQGGLVHLVWNASYLDVDPDFTVGSYDVWRQIDAGAAVRAVARGTRLLSEGEPHGEGPAIRTTVDGATTLTWEFLGSVPARAAATYSFPAATLGDSASDGPHDTVFMVDAQARSGFAFWDSAPVAGHSVDNLAPVMPSAFTGNYSAGATHLHWEENTEADLGGYRLYRGTDPTFVPGPANLVATLSDTGYTDTGPAGSDYKLAAFDVHGNVGSYALLAPSQTSGVPPGGEFAFGLREIRPNPARGSAEVEFSLPAEARARIDVYDVTGRDRRTLFDGVLPAGARNLRWDLRDASGRALGPGLYFMELRSGSRTQVRRSMILE